MCLTGCSTPTDPNAGDGSAACGDTARPCPPKERLTALSVVSGASQNGVSLSDTWATARHPTNKTVVEAITEPNTAAVWAHLQWSGDGDPVAGAPNRRQLSRATSKVLRTAASLGGTQQGI